VSARRRASSTIAAASGCSERLSTAAAAARRSSADVPANAITSVTTGFPVVSVPVLSNAMARTRPSVSRKVLPLNRMPLRAPLDSAERRVGIIEAASAHGDATTRKIMPR